VLNCIGIDVSKSTLNVHIAKNSQDLKTDNTLAVAKKLYAKLKKIYKKEVEELVFVFEPTGSYSELLRKFCADKSIQCFRQYFPKGSSFENITAEKIQEVENKLNHRPRKTLGWKTPYEVFYGLKPVA